MCLYIIDAVAGIKVLMKINTFDLDLLLLYFNILVMNVFNLTQFHLFFWMAKSVFNIMVKIFRNKFFDWIYEKINLILNIVWIKFDLFKKLVEQKLDDEQIQ